MEPEIVEDFYGVYLLYCVNPRYKGRIYIGYTRDPNRRIIQHNRGASAGGAFKTSKRGPWKMVMIVHGFPNNISALRFEWAWQNPGKTTRLQELCLIKNARKETVFKFKLRVLTEMLRVGPWCRLPLVIRWLENEFMEEFPVDRKPPNHMIIMQGPVKIHNHIRTKHIPSSNIECLLCSGYIKSSEILSCFNKNCDLVAHITCLAEFMLPPGEYIPIEGPCPLCDFKLKWGDLIRKMKGCIDFDGVDVVGQNNDAGCMQKDIVTDDDCPNFLDDNAMELSEDDDVICTQDFLSDEEQNFDNEEVNDDVICISKPIPDNPSWFLDCNEDLT